jgi:hypothetical protein
MFYQKVKVLLRKNNNFAKNKIKVLPRGRNSTKKQKILLKNRSLARKK